MGKRHGKGADFVRAVNEIIDSFEKLKKPELVSRANGDDANTAYMEDEAHVVTVDQLSAGTTNDLDSLTEAAVAAAAEDALQNEGMQLVEAPSNPISTETPLCPAYLTRNKTDVARLRKTDSRSRKPARMLRSSSRRDASRLRSIKLPSSNTSRISRRSNAKASDDRFLRSRRIIKSSDDSEGQDADSRAFVENDSIEESDSRMMSVDSDTPSIDEDSTVDSFNKLAGAAEPVAEENNEGEMELSDRLEFQSNHIIKKKRKPNRKRHHNDTVDAAKPDIVASDAEELKTECISPIFNEIPAQKYAKDDGDEHLPLVKRARVRMGRPSSAVEEDVTSLQKEEKMSEIPESRSLQSFEPLSCNVDTPANRDPVPISEEPAISSLSHVIPANNRPSLWETRKNFVDGEAALPPSKRLHRALEAMSANVAEDSQRASSCSPTANIQSNGYCPSSSLECSEMSNGRKGVSNGDSLLSASEFCIVSNVERSEDGAEIIAVVSDCGKTCSIDGSNLELCRDSSEQAGCPDAESLKIIPLVEVPTEISAEHHVKVDSVDGGEQLTNSNCNKPSSEISEANHGKAGGVELNEAAMESDPDMFQIHSDSTFVQDISGGSPNIDTCTRLESADGEGDGAHNTKHSILADNNQDSKMSEFVEEARPASLNSKIMHPVTPVKVLNNGHNRSLLHSTSISCDHIEDRTVSVTQSSSSLTDGPDSVARASPPSSSIGNISTLDNNKALENNSFSYPDVQLHLEKAKLAGKFSSKGEALSSFEGVIKSLTRTKESIGRATRIAIDCAKSGLATKVVEILAHNLEKESSLHKKVDLFFLVDSITQCSRGIKGDGGVYPSAIQAVLPRLLLAAAPPGSSSHESHRQCLKVLRVWQERKILPEPIIRHHIRELDALCGSYPTIGSNRSLRNERAFDDPIREMEGMQVDEYGSNSSIQLPGFCMPPMLRDDDVGSDSDGESFEAVTPEHNVDNLDGEKKILIPPAEKRRHILEDVDGELEMEDVAPCCEDELTSTNQTQISHQQSDNNYVQQPKDATRTLSRSPPPPPHPLPPPIFPPAVLNSVSNGHDSNPYSSSQNFNGNFQEPTAHLRALPRVRATNVDAVHNVRESKDFEAEVPRHMPDSNGACFSDRPTSRFSGRASNSNQPNDAFSKSFHLRPPHPAPSNQFSYVQERVQSRRDNPPPSRPNRFHTRNSDNGNFYRDRDRNKFGQRDNIGEGWRPPFPSISGPCYPDGARMANAPMSYGGPPREPPLPHNRWNVPSRPMNHRHFNPYRPPSEGPIPVANRGPNYWRPR